MQKAKIGSISHGTLNPVDLIPAFADELERLVKGEPDESVRQSHLALIAECAEIDTDNLDSEIEIIDELQDALEHYAPPYTNFGAHEGDGSDFGFWPNMEELEEGVRGGDVLKVGDLSEVTPDNNAATIMLVNDHGNVTVYSCILEPKLTELWACV